MHRYSNVLLDRLTPMEIPGIPLERWGSEADGGYVLPTNPMQNVSLLISGGVGDNVEFEADVAAHVPSIRIALFDHTVSELPGYAPKSARWYKIGLGARSEFLTLEGAIQKASANPSDVIAIKLDIEGAEWEVLDSTSDDFWKRISILIIELHHLNDKHRWKFYANVLGKLEANLICIHVHGNNHDQTVHFTHEDVHVPVTLELTYLNRSLIPVDTIPGIWDHPGPTKLDRPNKKGVPDLRFDYWMPRKFPFLRRLKRNVARMLWLR